MGDHMILQQNSSVKLWGWADNKKVTVTTSWNNQTYQVLTDKNGAWLVKVDTPGASYTPYSITIRCYPFRHIDRGGLDLFRSI